MQRNSQQPKWLKGSRISSMGGIADRIPLWTLYSLNNCITGRSPESLRLECIDAHLSGPLALWPVALRLCICFPQNPCTCETWEQLIASGMRTWCLHSHAFCADHDGLSPLRPTANTHGLGSYCKQMAQTSHMCTWPSPDEIVPEDREALIGAAV